MIEEMIWAFDSPGNVSTVLIIALLFRDPTNNTRGRHGPQTTEMCRAGLGRSELVGCGVRLGPMAAASLNSEGARAMPMPT